MKVTRGQLRQIIREAMEQLELDFPVRWPPPGRKKTATDRKDLIPALRKAGYTIDWFEMAEKWDPKMVQKDGSPYGIIQSGESGRDLTPSGERVYDYYSEDYNTYDIGVHMDFMKELEKHGWYAEWIDAGTITLVPEWEW